MSNIIPEPPLSYKQIPITYEVKDGCWICTNHLTKQGRLSALTRNGKKMLVHQYVLALYKGEPQDPSHSVIHSCRNVRCINPEHLRYGKMMMHESSSKVTAEEVALIKDLLASTNHTMREIGEPFGLSINSIKSINRGRTWKHVCHEEYGIPVRPWLGK